MLHMVLSIVVSRGRRIDTCNLLSVEFKQNCTTAAYSIDSKLVVKWDGLSRKTPRMGYSFHCLTQPRSCVECQSTEDLALDLWPNIRRDIC